MTRVRSTPYPFYDLEKSIGLASSAFSQIGSDFAEPDAMKEYLGMSATSSSGARALSTLELFGLLEQRKRLSNKVYKLTDLAIELVRAYKDGNKPDAELLKKAALGPDIVRLVWERTPDQRYINEQQILSAINNSPEVKISQSAESKVIDNIRDTLVFAGLSEYNKNDFSPNLMNLHTQNSMNNKPLDAKTDLDEQLKDAKPPSGSDNRPSVDEPKPYYISFPSGEVTIHIPKTLTKDDAETVKAWVNSLMARFTS